VPTPSRAPGPSRRGGPTAIVVLVLALVLSACGGTDEVSDDATATPAATELAVAIASFDLSVGDDQRLLAGVFTPERELLVFGEITFQLGFLGEQAGGEAELSQEATARFLPVPGMEPAGGSQVPTLLDDGSGTGVYEARVDLDQAGFWGLRVVAELDDGRTLEGQITFPVQEQPLIRGVGDPAPPTENLTLDDVAAGTARPVALDSRAQDDDTPVEDIPDPHLHQRTVADSLADGRPVVVMISTPVYCVSRFCGPLVSVVSDLATTYADRADFVHIEVWEDFDEQELNAAAAEWIQTEVGGNEPWVFLVGADGTISARWDNVLDLEELEAELDSLPSIGPAVSGDADA
jgi:hypothetical protein